MLIGIVFIVAYVVLGLTTYFVAPRIGPNSVLGVRTSATLANRQTWDAANRRGGLILIAMGLGLVPIVVALEAAGASSGVWKWSVLAYVGATVAVLVAWTVGWAGKMGGGDAAR